MSIISKFKDIVSGINSVSRGAVASLDYKSPSGGYMNYAIFKVVGINPDTGRQKTIKVECKTQ